MEEGFYWVKINTDEPEVVQVIYFDSPNANYRNIDIMRCGDDRSYYKEEGGVWLWAGKRISVVFLSGKLAPPDA